MSISDSSSIAPSASLSTGKNGPVSRDEIQGKSVVGQDAKIVGTVKDLAVSADGKVSLLVEKKNVNPEGSSPQIYINSEEILAVGDLVLLKTPKTDSKGLADISNEYQSRKSSPPPFPGSLSGRLCAKCNFANAQTSRFCVKCGSQLN